MKIAATGKKSYWSTGTDHAEFWCVWKGAHFRLASGAKHRKEQVGIPGGPNEDKFILVDAQYRVQLAPKSEVTISHRI